VLDEVRALANDGVKEIMLLGQNVNAYNAGIPFPALLRSVHEIPGLLRIRFMTSHPKDFSDELIEAVRDLPRVCKSVHLPLQSGSTRILADMNRRYTREAYLSLANRLQDAVPGIGIGTDIIVGYPGETEADFEDTLDMVRRVRFSNAFTFIYSKRGGTPAAGRTDTVPRPVANERFERLTDTLYPLMLERNRGLVGQRVAVMVETKTARTYKGRADDNTLVHFTSPDDLPYRPGDIVPVGIDSARTFYLSGAVPPTGPHQS
jgi:tRNA-2-methylthio-N6-dimethylallyladenosine synthase